MSSALTCLSQKGLDRIVDGFLVANLGEDQLVVGVADADPQRTQVLAAAVGAFDLAVAEQVHRRQQLLAQQLQAGLVVFAPVVAVGELEDVDVPIRRRKLVGDQIRADFVGRTDPRAAAFARAVERVFVHFLGRGVVDDVARFEPVVLALEPGIDPERLGAHDLLLLVGHRARYVHHVDRHGAGVGLRDGASRSDSVCPRGSARRRDPPAL